MSRLPLARVAGFAFGASIALSILAVQLPPARTAFGVLAVVLAVAGVLTAGMALRDAGRGSGSDESRLRRDGVLGRALVLAAAGTGRRRGEREEIETRLDVQLPMRRRFEVVRRDWLTGAERDRVVVGRPVMIAADPEKPGHVVLVLDIPDVDERAISALGPIAGGRGGPPRPDLPSPAGADEIRRNEGEPARDP